MKRIFQIFLVVYLHSVLSTTPIYNIYPVAGEVFSMNPGNLLLDTKGIANTFEITDSTTVNSA